MTTKSKGTTGPLDPSNGRDAIESITAERDRLREVNAELVEAAKSLVQFLVENHERWPDNPYVVDLNTAIRKSEAK